MKIDSGKKPNKKRFNVIAGILVAIGLIIGLVIALTPDQQLEKFNGAGAITFSNLLIVFGGIILLNVHVLTPATKRFQNRFIPRMERAYSKFLAYALNGLRPVAFIG